jgi:pimeloyl-ACP methyl ester carboxylesterase
MKTLKRGTLYGLCALLLYGLPAAAEMLVLVHGYASGPATWAQSGVSAALVQAGWTPSDLNAAAPAGGESGRRFYAAALPGDAPLVLQLTHLQGFLARLRQRYPQDRLTLVGHSAGGVVARLALLSGNPYRVERLVTIAAPHLGTPRAGEGLEAVESKPFFCPGPGISLLKEIFGGGGYHALQRSSALFVDLLPAGSGSLIDWANAQPHPALDYHAVIHETVAGGDGVVPAVSQDLNQVPALRGHATVWINRSGHFLNPEDGRILVEILK